MSRVGFETTIPVFKLTGAVHDLDLAATESGRLKLHSWPTLSSTVNSPCTFKGTLVHESSSKYVRIGFYIPELLL
jgi:hypothetical protein